MILAKLSENKVHFDFKGSKRYRLILWKRSLINQYSIHKHCIALNWQEKKLKQKKDYTSVLDCTSLFFLLVVVCLKHDWFWFELAQSSSLLGFELSGVNCISKVNVETPPFPYFLQSECHKVCKKNKEALIHRIYLK